MATDLQRKALDKVVEYGRAGKRISKGKLLKEVGYAGTTAIAPQKVFESKGFLQLCDDLGLTDDFLTKALVDDIQAKPKRRFKELELGFKIRGRLNPDGFETPKGTTITNFTQIVINPPHATGNKSHS